VKLRAPSPQAGSFPGKTTYGEPDDVVICIHRQC